MERQRREFEAGERRWRALEAWRTSRDAVLVYFLPLDAGDGEPADDDRLDRRAALAPGRRLEELDAAGLEELLASGTPLTETERRFRAPDGRPWLAQSVGPVWAEDGVAGGLTGVLFSSLAGDVRRERGPGEHVGRASRERLAGWWRSTVQTADDDAEVEGPGEDAAADAPSRG